ncbi:MAG: GerMN domain-containing protein [Acidimicrobiales bacterium]
MTHDRRLPLLLLAAAVAAAVALVGCGVPFDDSPRPIAQTTATTEAGTPTTAASSDAPTVGVYFLRGDRLERQDYPVDGEPTLRQALEFVLAEPAGDTELRSSVPPGTVLRHVEVADRTATVDLTDAINDVNGQAQKEAFAQMAFTILDFGGVDTVRFLVDGDPVDAPTDQGNLAVVTADDYSAPLNPR